MEQNPYPEHTASPRIWHTKKPLIIGILIIITLILIVYAFYSQSNKSEEPLNSDITVLDPDNVETNIDNESAKEPTIFTIGNGESITYNSIILVPIKIISDSRCPQGTECAWEGNVAVETKVSDQVFEFVTGVPQTIQGVTIELASVSPEKSQSNPLNPDDVRYVYTFK